MFARCFGLLGLLAAGMLVVACDEDPPTAPSPQPASITAGAIVPPSGGSVTATGEPPGAYIVRGSGGVAVPLALTSGRDVPHAELLVFLETSTGVACAANLNDAPSWTPFSGASRLDVTVSGFQVFRLPCQVARIHVIFDTRNSPGNFGNPNPADILAETTIPVNFTIR